MDTEFMYLMAYFLGGLSLFFIGFRMATKNANHVDTETMKEEFWLDEEDRETPLGGVLLGTLIMCLGAIPVGGVLLGWNSHHIFSELMNIF